MTIDFIEFFNRYIIDIIGNKPFNTSHYYDRFIINVNFKKISDKFSVYKEYIIRDNNIYNITDDKILSYDRFSVSIFDRFDYDSNSVFSIDIKEYFIQGDIYADFIRVRNRELKIKDFLKDVNNITKDEK